VRLVIRETSGALHAFSKALVPTIQALFKHLCVKFDVHHIVDNSLEVVKAIELFSLPPLHPDPVILVSADVKSMYPSFNKLGILKEIQILLEHSDYDAEVCSFILKAVEFILWNNYFVHDEKVYKATEGVAIGDPISVILTNLSKLRHEALI